MALRAENDPTATDGKNDDIRKHTPAKLALDKETNVR